MTELAPNSGVLAFADLLEYLRRHGFSIGVDHHLRLQELLRKISGGCDPGDLKTLLCPIFATSKNQQEQFYRAFDLYFDLYKPSTPAPESLENELGEAAPRPDDAKSNDFRKWPYVLAITSVFAVIALSIIFTPKPKPVDDGVETIPIPSPAQVTIPVGQAPLPKPTLEPLPQPSVKAESFYQRYGNAIRLTAVLVPLILFLFYEWRRFNRRKLILHKQSSKKPPYTWPIRVEASTPKLYDSEQFYTAARIMRRRQVDEFYRLDIDATIAATIESLGYPSLRFKPYSKAPEYLVLIDRASFQDHQAHLYDELAKALEGEGLFVARYFYDGDPRVCYGERGEGYLHLTELQNKYAAHRLLIFGNGERMIDPITGKLASWATVFSNWHDRALLTPENPARWMLREIALAGQFIVLPATLDGLLALVDHFESPVTTEHLRSWPKSYSETLPSLELDQADVVAALRSYLGEETFQWLCACAVYPELQWDLTLYLGSLPCMEGNLLREKNLLRLIRLPWFRSGSIPDDIRWLLIRELDQKKEKAIRLAIIELLEKNPPQKETFAADAYQLNLVVQRWLFRRDRQRRREMLQVMRTLPQSRVVRDHTLLRFLESKRVSPLDVILPRRLRKLFYRNGMPAFGLRTSVRFLTTVIVMAALWVGIKPPNSTPSPENQQIKGEIVEAPAIPRKLYKSMTDEEKKEFIKERAEHIAIMMGKRPYAFTPEALDAIKFWLDAFARRVNNGGGNRLWSGDMRFVFGRAIGYAPIIIRAFKEHQVPVVVGLYIPVIETEYTNIRTNDFAGAAGLFQFLGPTAEAYGVPAAERTDVEKMAPAAAKYMRDNILSFGDDSMSVALSIYDYSRNPESVKRDLRNVLSAKNNEDKEHNFWTLIGHRGPPDGRFQNERANYVARFFAAAIMGETPEAFGLGMRPLSTYTESIKILTSVPPTASLLSVSQTEHALNEVAASSDGEMVATVGDENDVLLWQTSDGELSLFKKFWGHEQPGRSVAVSLDGEMVASGSGDGSIRLWQISDGSLLNTLIGHTKYVFIVGFSPTGKIWFLPALTKRFGSCA